MVIFFFSHFSLSLRVAPDFFFSILASFFPRELLLCSAFIHPPHLLDIKEFRNAAGTRRVARMENVENEKECCPRATLRLHAPIRAPHSNLPITRKKSASVEAPYFLLLFGVNVSSGKLAAVSAAVSLWVIFPARSFRFNKIYIFVDIIFQKSMKRWRNHVHE